MVYQTEFRTSVNIEYDIGKDSFLRGYLPTPSHAESIIGISKGFTNYSSNSAHILVGPYGSGKSLLATILASIISKGVSETATNTLIEGFNNVHQDVYGSLLQLKDIERTYLPIALNGSYDDFADALLATIQNELINNGFTVELPTERNNVLKIINQWYLEFPSTYKLFEEKLIKSKRSKSIEQWSLLIKNGDKDEIEWFKKIYNQLTSGAVFDPLANGDLLESLEVIMDFLERNNLGLFIIHDEFGRFLQGLEQNKINKTMQNLQDIAEFVNRTNGRINLLLISHRSMSRYMVGFYEEYQSEFERIEKRFSSYYVESDSATYYRIVERFLTSKKLISEKTPDNVKDISLETKRYNLFQDLNQHEIDNLIVKGCYPFHPVTLFMLPRISRVFGQNERTLFTYLTSSEAYSFNKEIKKDKNYIYADTLFQYFFSEKTIENLYDENTKRIIQLYTSVRSNLDARKTNAYRVIRFITLWELTNSNNVYKLNKELISFGTGIRLEILSKVLDELIGLKYIRLNRIRDQIELSEGSSIVIEELIEEKRTDLKIDEIERTKLLYEVLNKKYYLAISYNDEKNMTRFMRTQIIRSSNLLNQQFNMKQFRIPQSDGSINYLLLDKKSDYGKVTKLISNVNDEKMLFVVMKNDFALIKEYVDRLIIIKELNKNTKLLHEYKNLNTDLEIYSENYQYEIENFLAPLINFTDTVEWYHKGKPILIKNELDLEVTISNIMWSLFPDTPLIMNDSVNRFNVSGIQLRSLLGIIDKVLNQYDEKNIGIEGQGPEYLIYATLIKNMGINLTNLNQIEDKFIKSIRNRLLQYLNQNNKGQIKELFDILSESPFGMRPPLISVYLVILLRDKWNQFIFYRNEMFVPANDGEKIYEMFKSPDKYEYVFQDLSKEKATFLIQLEDRFRSYISENVYDESQIIKVSSGLLNWLRSLPKQTQITNNFTNERLNKLKKLIRKSEVNPLQCIRELIDFYKGSFKELENDIQLLENAFDLFKIHVEDTLCHRLEIDEFNSKNLFLEKWDKEKQLKNNLLSILSKSVNIVDFSFSYIGTELKDWSDINYELFVNQLNSDYDSLFSNNEIEANIYELQVNDTYKKIKKISLSKKSEIIYSNMERMVKNAGRTVSQDEINNILLKLINEFVN